MQYIQLQPQNPSTIITPGEGHYNLFLDETDLGFKIKNSEETLLPVSDTYITGGTFSDDTLTLTDNVGNTIEIPGIGLDTDNITAITITVGSQIVEGSLVAGSLVAGSLNVKNSIDVVPELPSTETFVTVSSTENGTAAIIQNSTDKSHFYLYNATTESGVKIKNSNITDDRTIELPDASGTLALTSQLTPELVVSVTYEELVDKITGSTLVPGQHYLINDFRTCYDQPDYNSTGQEVILANYRMADVDPIIVLAISGNTIDVNAYQPTYPKDKIKYDWTYNVTEVTGGVAYGRITERIDDRNNRTDYDHRTVLFKRYVNWDVTVPANGRILSNTNGVIIGENTTFTTDFSINDVIYLVTPWFSDFYKVTGITSNTEMSVLGINYYNFNYDEGYSAAIIYKTDGPWGWGFTSYKPNNIPGDNGFTQLKTFDDSDTVVNNYIGDYANHYDTIGLSSFMLSNNVFTESHTYNNNIGSQSINNTAKSYFHTNEIGGRFVGNIIGQQFNTNQIGSDFSFNLIPYGFYKNEISNNFNRNTLLASFYENEIGIDFNRNATFNNFYRNTINYEFNNNFCFAEIYKNILGPRFKSNLILNEFASNNINESCIENKFSGFFGLNTIGSFFQNNTFLGSCAYNHIGNEFIGNYIGDGFGFGGGNTQKNVIGDYFYSNTIGEYFYNNTIGNNFKNNIIHNDFQWNDVKTEINNQDFTVYKGVIDTFGYTTNIVTSLSDGYYTGVVGTPQGGIEGDGAVFAVNVIGNVVASLGISDYGHLYEVGNQIVLSGVDFGGSLSDTITVTVTGLESTPSVYETTTSNIFEIRGGEKRVSYYDADDTLIIAKEWEDGPPLP